jgi:hypothetical protein
MKDDAIIVKCFRRHLEALMRLAEPAEVIGRLEETALFFLLPPFSFQLPYRVHTRKV